jgi:hypothetical protein
MFLIVPIFLIAFLSTSTISTWTELKNSNLSSLQSIKVPLINIFTPNSGQDTLPSQVQEMLSLMQAHYIESYQLSTQLNQATQSNFILIKERIIEAAWPLKETTTSPYILYLLAKTKVGPNCVLIDEREDVGLEYCR